jgi:[NiFe] hydrogenase assembly HybE family chaperone
MGGADRMNAGITAAAPWQARVDALEALFREIAATRMAGIPILHPGLRVQAVDFEPESDGRCAVGVLVTPWFMNLVRLPLGHGPDDPDGPDGAGSAPDPLAPVGVSRTRVVGNERFDFLGAHEPGFGTYEICSLFSPMAQFVDHAAAEATARAVMAELRKPPPPPAAPAAPSRRALLFGRTGGEGTAR